MNPYIELLRPFNCVMTIIAVIIGALLIGGLAVFGSPALYFAIIAAFLITGAGNAVNDYYDMEADMVNRPKRPIPSGRVSQKAVLYYSILLFIIGVAFSGFLPLIAIVIAIINSALLILYSYYFQHKAYIGNIVVSYLVGSIYLFGAAAFWNGSAYLSVFFTLPLILFSMSFLANFSREIVKDLEDIEGDMIDYMKRAARAKSAKGGGFEVTKKGVEFKANKKAAGILAFLFIIIAIVVSFFPYTWGIFGLTYLIIVILADLMFLYTAIFILKSRTKKDYGLSSKRIKIAMLIGLLAFIAGALSG